MLAFFRRVLSSWMAVALLALIMIAFIVTGVGTPGGGLVGGGPGADAVATVGGKSVSTAEISRRANQALRQAREQQPSLTMGQFLAAVGGLGPIVEQTIGATVLTEWAQRHGIAASERLVGGEIGKVPAFHGPTGEFNQDVMNNVLAQQRLTFASMHDDFRDDLIRRQLLTPIMASTRAPESVLRAYSQLVIDQRQGAIGMIPAKVDAIPAPTDQEVSDFYKAHIAHYSLPERRALRYALINADTVTPTAPTDAEVAAQYKTDAAKYAAGETRTIQRVVLPDQNAANAFAAKLAKGTSFAQAATEAGLAPADIAVGAVAHDAFAGTDGKAIADAAFALPKPGNTAPVKSALGWAIAHVETITKIPARSLEQATPEIRTALAKKKADDALATTVGQVEDSVGDGAAFNEIVAKHKLQVTTTPPLLPNGTAPSDANFKADANVTALLKAAADATADDEPTVENLDATHFALLSVASVVPAAPVPFAEVKARVAQDMQLQRAAEKAHALAQAVLAKVQGGQPLAAAFTAAGLEAPKPIALTQLELSRAGQNVPTPIRVLFRLAPGKADLVQGPNGSWFVVKLDQIAPGNAQFLPMVMSATRGELQRSLGDEYAQQFANAARDEVKVKRNPQALGALDQQLRGNGQ
jgi:peptidyl-prolyl cis-trans isomerase D